MKINFFTANFPYTKSEPYIENEIPVIAANCEELRIFPFDRLEDKHVRSIPNNSKVIDARPKGSISLSFSDHFKILMILIGEIRYANNRGYFLKHIRTFRSVLIKAMLFARKLEKLNHVNRNDLYYSYWMNEWATVLMILKREKKISHFVFRCGGFDIWDERRDGNYMPFRGSIYKHASGVFPNSYKAEQYIRAKKLFPEIVKHQYWGTVDHGMAPFESGQPFTLVSCSNVIPLKRIELIIDTLEKVDRRVRWIHFGDGAEFENITTYANKIRDQHEVEFTGNISNQEIYDFYKTNTVHLFITTSSTEGLPVSIQEAISFGIPILATDVGGMNEVVTPATGKLIPADFNVEEVANFIENFEYSNFNTLEFRKGIRAFWLKNFEAKSTYQKFYELIESIMRT